MKLLICGSRNITNFDLTPYIPNECELIISGGAKGVDTIAEEYANTHGIPKRVLRTDCKTYGKEMPVGMVDGADAVLAVWDGQSEGTAYTLICAASMQKPMAVITNE